MIRQTSVKPAPAAPKPPIVVIVDDDPAVRESLDSLIRSVGLATRLFGAPADVLQGTLPDAPGCIVLDVRLPGISGLDFQDQLGRHGIDLPIVFMTGHGDIPMTVRAMKAGAVDFLAKPFRDQEMLDAVTAAIERDRQRLPAGRRNGAAGILQRGEEGIGDEGIGIAGATIPVTGGSPTA